MTIETHIQTAPIQSRSRVHARRRGARSSAVEDEIAAIAGSDLAALRVRWREIFGANVSPKLGRDFLTRVLAFRIQLSAYDGLDHRIERALERIAGGEDPLVATAMPQEQRYKPGIVLAREWRGEMQHVEVLAEGYAWKGQRFASLSAVARAITGTNWSGRAFFGLRMRGSRIGLKEPREKPDPAASGQKMGGAHG
jgi:hypothetical protein